LSQNGSVEREISSFDDCCWGACHDGVTDVEVEILVGWFLGEEFWQRNTVGTPQKRTKKFFITENL